MNTRERFSFFTSDYILLMMSGRLIEVLHWLRKGNSYRWIAMHMGLSHSHQTIEEKIVEKFGDYVPNVPDVSKDTILQEYHMVALIWLM